MLPDSLSPGITRVLRRHTLRQTRNLNANLSFELIEATDRDANLTFFSMLHGGSIGAER